jgi:hypothetical protein
MRPYLNLLIYGAGVNEDWLSRPLRALPLFIVMAHGSRAYNKDTAGVNGKLLSTPADGDKLVNIQLLRTQLPQRLTVHIQGRPRSKTPRGMMQYICEEVLFIDQCQSELDRNSELITCVNCICADGTFLTLVKKWVSYITYGQVLMDD